MAEATTKLPVKNEPSQIAPSKRIQEWRPFESLRNQVDRLFRDFETGFPQLPFYRDIDTFWRGDVAFPVTPAVDVVEKENAFELTAELPGLDAKNIELVSDDVLTIKGEKNEEKEEKAKDRYVSERRYGSFRRSLQLPAGVDPAKIEASYKSGVLSVTLPKSAEAKKKKQTVIPITAK